MTEAEARRAAPNINLFLWRPILAAPPIYTQHDLKTWVTLSDVLDAHEALDLQAMMNEKAAAKHGH